MGDSDGPIVALGNGVGSDGKVKNGAGVGEGDGVGEMGTKMGSDDTGDGVGEPLATPPPPGRAKATSIAPMTSPTRAKASAAMIGQPTAAGRNRTSPGICDAGR